jgi:hypothetical protein
MMELYCYNSRSGGRFICGRFNNLGEGKNGTYHETFPHHAVDIDSGNCRVHWHDSGLHIGSPLLQPLPKSGAPKGLDRRQPGSKVTDIFGYSGAGGQSIMVLGIQPLRVDTIGDIDISFNGIPLGQTRIENTLVVNTSIASCCFVTFIQAGVDNVVEITSYGFEGLFRYLIIIPTK